MDHVFERASSGRARCRGCAQAIPKGELRFGERLPNPFAEGEMTHWFHPLCAAYKRPEPLLQALEAPQELVPEADRLRTVARRAMLQRRLPRIDGAEKASSSQARCRHCREPIGKGTWRIRLTFYDEGNFAPGGFIHLACRVPYFEADDILEHLLHFSRGLGDEEREALRRELGQR